MYGYRPRSSNLAGDQRCLDMQSVQDSLSTARSAVFMIRLDFSERHVSWPNCDLLAPVHLNCAPLNVYLFSGRRHPPPNSALGHRNFARSLKAMATAARVCWHRQSPNCNWPCQRSQSLAPDAASASLLRSRSGLEAVVLALGHLQHQPHCQWPQEPPAGWPASSY
ncbi:hypothetical protein GY45DRAFT_1164126 [Cubamyces sp. BRFM 1775]|nr:hypothetical protein GY45DRAFT_1164126 [Cubamyces sp. BRFM 1775]